MNFVELLFHLGNFVLPAMALALLMPLAGRWVMGRGAVAWHRRMCFHGLAGTAVLTVGLISQGHDGRMATYALLVLVSACLEWLLQRGWRR